MSSPLYSVMHVFNVLVPGVISVFITSVLSPPLHAVILLSAFPPSERDEREGDPGVGADHQQPAVRGFHPAAGGGDWPSEPHQARPPGTDQRAPQHHG